MIQRNGAGVFGLAWASGSGSSWRIAESVSTVVPFWNGGCPVAIS